MDICVIGGDERMAMLAEAAANEGEHVICCGLDKRQFGHSVLSTDSVSTAIGVSEAVILPLPVTRDGVYLFAPLSRSSLPLDEIISGLSADKRVFCGMPGEELLDRIRKTGAEVTDYFAREELNVLNAVSTAEGAVELAMRETDRTVFESKTVVIGFGRVGKAVSRVFHALGADVTVSARKKGDLAAIRTLGYTPVKTSDIALCLCDADIVINTVPAPVIGEKELDGMKRDAVVIDLASLPGGVDFAHASSVGIKAIHALSLPGKVAPRSAAEVILSTVTNIIAENETNRGDIYVR